MAQNQKKRRRGADSGPPTEAPPAVNLDLVKESDGEPAPIRQIELFTYNEKTYYMAEPGANMMLKVLREARESGMIGAVGTMLQEMIGDEAYTVLMGIDDLSNEELTGIINRVVHYATGRMEGMLGNS